MSLEENVETRDVKDGETETLELGFQELITVEPHPVFGISSRWAGGHCILIFTYLPCAREADSGWVKDIKL